MAEIAKIETFKFDIFQSNIFSQTALPDSLFWWKMPKLRMRHFKSFSNNVHENKLAEIPLV